MVIDSDRENSLGLLLTNYILVEDFVNFFGDRQLGILTLGTRFLNFFPDDVVTQVYAFVANEDRRASNKLTHFVLAFTAKRAIQQFSVIA